MESNFLKTQHLLPHALGVHELESTFQTNLISGLSENESKRRLLKYGANQLPQAVI
jgi:hypothetical protein